MPDAVLVEVAAGMAVLTISRPAARNAINGAVAPGIAGAISRRSRHGAVSDRQRVSRGT
jgi:enoyl-CoA hydratase/carnithine racemase